MRYARPGIGWVRRIAGTLVTTLMLVGLLTPSIAVAASPQSMYGNDMVGGGMNGGDEWARVYTVRPGDTLAGIAMSFGVTQDALMYANGIRNANKIYVGQQLVIPEKSGDWNMGTGGPECASYYTVRRSDTLSGIAQYYGLETWSLARANGIYDLNEIYSGQSLCIPGDGNKSMQGDWNEPMQGGWSEPMPMAPDQGMDRGMDQGMGGPMEPDRSMGGSMEPSRGTGGPVMEPDHTWSGQTDAGWSGPDDARGPMEPDHSMDRGMDGGMDQGMGGPMEPDRSMGGDWMGPDQPMDGPNRGGPNMQADEYWKGTYFNDKYFSEFALERKDLEVNFNWYTGSPFSDMSQDRFSVRWEKIESFRGGRYRFHAVADDGVRVIVDDQTIIDACKIQPATEYTADLNLGEGLHKLVVEYYEEAEDAQIHVYWEPLRK